MTKVLTGCNKKIDYLENENKFLLASIAEMKKNFEKLQKESGKQTPNSTRKNSNFKETHYKANAILTDDPKEAKIVDDFSPRMAKRKSFFSFLRPLFC